jgi:peptidoglycan/LPS O-acetylase OafA/YrhL
MARMFGIPGLYFVSIGGLAVSLFLVLSGFVMQLSYGTRSEPYGRFLWKRLARIYPVYWMSLAFAVAVFAIQSYRDTGSLTALRHVVGLRHALLAVTGFYAFAGAWGGPFVATSWYIGLIVALYAVFPLLAKAVRSRPAATLVALLLVSVATRLSLGWTGWLPNRPLDWFPPCRLFEFGLGMALARWCGSEGIQALRRLRLPAAPLRFLGDVSFPLFLVHYPLLRMLWVLPKRGVPLPAAVVMYVLVSVLVSWMLVLADTRVQRVLRRKPSR